MNSNDLAYMVEAFLKRYNYFKNDPNVSHWLDYNCLGLEVPRSVGKTTVLECYSSTMDSLIVYNNTINYKKTNKHIVKLQNLSNWMRGRRVPEFIFLDEISLTHFFAYMGKHDIRFVEKNHAIISLCSPYFLPKSL